LGVKSKLTCN